MVSDLPEFYHGTPVVPVSAIPPLLTNKKVCVSFFSKKSLKHVSPIAKTLMLDNGAFSFWSKAKKLGVDYLEEDKDWSAYYSWCEKSLRQGTEDWAIIPDVIAAPSQINDYLLNQWPLPKKYSSPVWHMNEPIYRLGKLLEQPWNRVSLGWVGENERENLVGSVTYFKKMNEVTKFLGNYWPKLHMLRGIAVASEFPFYSVDSTSLAQNGWRYDCEGKWQGRINYRDRLESGKTTKRLQTIFKINKRLANEV